MLPCPYWRWTEVNLCGRADSSKLHVLSERWNLLNWGTNYVLTQRSAKLDWRHRSFRKAGAGLRVRGLCSGAAHVAGHGCCPVKVCLDKGARWLQTHIHGACPSPRSCQGALVGLFCCSQLRAGVCVQSSLWKKVALRRWRLKLQEAGKALVKWPERLNSPETWPVADVSGFSPLFFICWCWTNEVPQIVMTQLLICIGAGEPVALPTLLLHERLSRYLPKRRVWHCDFSQADTNVCD